MIRAHATAVLSALNGTGATVYDHDQLINLPPVPYGVAYVDLGRGADPRMCGDDAGRAWRILVRFVGSTADEARWVAEKTWTALDGKRMTVTGRRCTPCRSESTQPIVPDPDDEDVYNGSAVWTFASHPAT